MEDLVDNLISDHMAVRIWRECRLEDIDLSVFKSFHDFITNCHMKIEENILYPLFKDRINKDNVFEKVINIFLDEHKLIRYLGSKIISLESDEEEFKRLLNLYLNIFLSHCSSEESILFPYWYKDISSDIRIKYSDEASKILVLYGYGKYTNIKNLIRRL